MEETDWVERQHRADRRFADSKPAIWRDLCDRLDEACRSFERLYDRKAERKASDGHHFRVLIHVEPKREVDVEFDESTGEIGVTCDADPLHGFKSFRVTADESSAFLTDGTGSDRLTPAQVSEQILQEPFFGRRAA